MSYTKHNFVANTLIQATSFNEMDNQIALNESNLIELTSRVSANETAIATLIPSPTEMRELTSTDCFSDTTYMVGDSGKIYISSSAPSIYNGPYTHLGIKATKLVFTHDFSGNYNTVFAGVVVDNDTFVGYPLIVSSSLQYMRAFTSEGSQTTFSNGTITTGQAAAGFSEEGIYTIEIVINDNQFAIKTNDTTIFEMTVNSGVEIKGIGIIRYTISYEKLLYNCSIIPMVSEEEEQTFSNNIAAEYYLKGNASKASRTKKLCIIGAGQSNIEGYVPQANLPNNAGFTFPISGMKYIKNSTSGTFGDSFTIGSNGWGFDAVLCNELINNLGSNNLYYIKWSQGGTAIDTSSPSNNSNRYWTADYEQLDNISYSLLYSFEQEIRKSAEINPNDYEIGAMIWHQGEADSSRQSPTASKNYYNNMQKIIAYCRGIVGNARLPFIFGTVAHESTDYDETIEEAMKKIAEEDPYVWLVDMSDAKLIVDSGDGWTAKWHFNADWSIYMGKKYYDCLIDAGVITGTKLNPTKPTNS